MTNDTRFTLPLYTVPLAASFLGMHRTTLNSWVGKPHLLTVLPGQRLEPRIPFMGLVEAQFYGELRRAGLSMQAIASGMKAVRHDLGDRMLERGVLAHDGKDILMNLASAGDNPEWERARDRQGGLPEIIEIGLKPIIYVDDDLPGRVRLTAYGNTSVVADPRFAFGQPIVEASGSRVEDILSLFKAGEAVSTVAEEMGVSTDDVESIVRMHLALAA
ncbi:MAG: DUF433 domain-containing protein [Bifidobacteriaceae bacterium]|jgi:uncharacterized protein (DUF433 family)|nr:DUF433 domain-containing protein [Bifidobacteriaceae bacterium]